jgi:hypothetical protein
MSAPLPIAHSLAFQRLNAPPCALPADISYLHDLILELWEEEVDDLVLLDWERVKVDLLHGLDLAGLDETTELGDWLPLLLLVLVGTTAWATSASAVTTAAVTASGTETGSSSWCVSHIDRVVSVGVNS